MEIAKAASLLHTETPLTWTKVGFTRHFKLAAKKPHIPQSLRSFIEFILGRLELELRLSQAILYQSSTTATGFYMAQQYRQGSWRNEKSI